MDEGHFIISYVYKRKNFHHMFHHYYLKPLKEGRNMDYQIKYIICLIFLIDAGIGKKFVYSSINGHVQLKVSMWKWITSRII